MPDNLLFESCRAKQLEVKNLFAHCTTAQMRYEKLIELGRTLPPYPKEWMTPCRIVKGCQSTMYLHTSLVNTKVQFQIHSDALISAGLAALLLAVYNNEPAIAILRCPPDFLEELGIHGSLSPSRSNGLSSLFLKMKQEALQFLL
jgi:cysteine desulfuration protein SufE